MYSELFSHLRQPFTLHHSLHTIKILWYDVLCEEFHSYLIFLCSRCVLFNSRIKLSFNCQCHLINIT